VGMPAGLEGRLLQLDVRTMQWHAMQVQKNPHCRVCASVHA